MPLQLSDLTRGNVVSYRGRVWQVLETRDNPAAAKLAYPIQKREWEWNPSRREWVAVYDIERKLPRPHIVTRSEQIYADAEASRRADLERERVRVCKESRARVVEAVRVLVASGGAYSAETVRDEVCRVWGADGLMVDVSLGEARKLLREVGAQWDKGRGCYR